MTNIPQLWLLIPQLWLLINQLTCLTPALWWAFYQLRKLVPSRIVRFLVTGGVNTGVSYLIFIVLVTFGVDYLLSSSLGYTVAMFTSYLANKKWTFKSKKSTSIKLFSQFIAINLLSLGGNLVILYFFVDKLGINLFVSQAAAIILTMAINYVSYKCIFR